MQLSAAPGYAHLFLVWPISQCFNESGPLTVEVIDAALPVILS